MVGALMGRRSSNQIEIVALGVKAVYRRQRIATRLFTRFVQCVPNESIVLYISWIPYPFPPSPPYLPIMWRQLRFTNRLALLNGSECRITIMIRMVYEWCTLHRWVFVHHWFILGIVNSVVAVKGVCNPLSIQCSHCLYHSHSHYTIHQHSHHTIHQHSHHTIHQHSHHTIHQHSHHAYPHKQTTPH